ncbi:beta-lactamase/transpeptidase-like protein [Colletotrichum acutatum]|uniref:Beta-lactamase/transpeptidase-like protein n=1 Tax=Glomerella acutata TaxID=27357 RepID=A0AAD8XA43_GLOAC|nr:beta-lactamase/transpeptidase-like protein [Colletotrichum acutatum]KAK1702151.1 beta-lactamase/transpeptidase-like protein [Colletotrichum acutatum]
MRLLQPFSLLAIDALVTSQRADLTNCPLLGPAYPLPNLHKSQVIKDKRESFTKLINNAISTGETELGKINTATASFSISVFSADSDEFLYEYHHQGTELKGTVTGGSLDSDTLYRIGSVTKLLTVYTILVKLGPTYWNEPITKFIPELADAPAGHRAHRVQWSEVTLGGLASHMSGIARNKVLNSLLEQYPATTTWHTPVYSNEAFQLIGWAFENITGSSVELTSLSRTGGVYSSLGDLSAIGRSILASSILPKAATREWLRPVTHTQHTHSAVGRPWEITRMDVAAAPGSKHTRLVDLYTKNGGIGAYLTYLILSPDHNIGFTLLTASKTAYGDGIADSTFDVLSELLLEKWIPAADAAGREAAGEDLAGIYVADDGSDSRAELTLVPGRIGLTLQKLVINGTDFFSESGRKLGFQGADLQFMGLQDQGKIAFRAVFSNPDAAPSGREPILGKKCGSTWGGAGSLTYGNIAIDEVVFTVGKDGKATNSSYSRALSRSQS